VADVSDVGLQDTGVGPGIPVLVLDRRLGLYTKVVDRFLTVAQRSSLIMYE
jgi:hypothetical protein